MWLEKYEEQQSLYIDSISNAVYLAHRIRFSHKLYVEIFDRFLRSSVTFFQTCSCILPGMSKQPQLQSCSPSLLLINLFLSLSFSPYLSLSLSLARALSPCLFLLRILSLQFFHDFCNENSHIFCIFSRTWKNFWVLVLFDIYMYISYSFASLKTLYLFYWLMYLYLSHLIRFDLNWFDLIWFDLIWFDLDWSDFDDVSVDLDCPKFTNLKLQYNSFFWNY